MPIEVTMPKLSPTMETGVIAQWLVKVGDQVKEGDVLADIETDKATMQMKSYDDGVIVHLDHAAGDEVALGQRVMVLAKKGEDPKQVAASLGAGSSGSAKTARSRRRETGSRRVGLRRCDHLRQRPAGGPGCLARPTGSGGPAQGQPAGTEDGRVVPRST